MNKKQICCGHVFRNEKDVLLVIRTEQCFQFLCGEVHLNEEPELIQMEELIKRDSSLTNIRELKINHSIERKDKKKPWVLKYYYED